MKFCQDPNKILQITCRYGKKKGEKKVLRVEINLLHCLYCYEHCCFWKDDHHQNRHREDAHQYHRLVAQYELSSGKNFG